MSPFWACLTRAHAPSWPSPVGWGTGTTAVGSGTGRACGAPGAGRTGDAGRAGALTNGGTCWGRCRGTGEPDGGTVPGRLTLRGGELGATAGGGLGGGIATSPPAGGRAVSDGSNR